MKHVVLAIAILLLATAVMAQPEKGQVGLGFNVTESGPGAMVRWWVSETVTIEPALAVRYVSLDDLDVSTTQLGLGIGVAWRKQTGTAFRPIVAWRFEYDMLVTEDKTYADMLVSGGLGGEYFFSRHFSVGGEVDLSLVFTDEDFSPNFPTENSTILTTSQMLTAHFYF